MEIIIVMEDILTIIKIVIKRRVFSMEEKKLKILNIQLINM